MSITDTFPRSFACEWEKCEKCTGESIWTPEKCRCPCHDTLGGSAPGQRKVKELVAT